MGKPITLPPEYEVREFQAADVLAYNGQWDAIQRHILEPEAYLKTMEMGACYTSLKHGRPVASGGVILGAVGTGVAWMFVSEDVRQHPRFHLVLAKRLFEIAEEEFKLHRIEATCDVHDTRAANWLEHLGFEREGRKRSFVGPGLDHWSYARVRG